MIRSVLFSYSEIILWARSHHIKRQLLSENGENFGKCFTVFGKNVYEGGIGRKVLFHCCKNLFGAVYIHTLCKAVVFLFGHKL